MARQGIKYMLQMKNQSDPFGISCLQIMAPDWLFVDRPIGI